jgi:hypothetical protein
VSGELSASYQFTPNDTYIRTAIRAPRTTIYLNPVLKYNGSLPQPTATVDELKTSLLRGGFAAAIIGGVLLYRRRTRLAGSERLTNSPTH